MDKLMRMSRRRREDGKAFTLLELIVVLLVLGVLAAIAVPTYNTLKTNSVNRSVDTTLDAIARAGEAAYISDPLMTDAEVAAAAMEGISNSGDFTISRADDTVTVTLDSGTISRSGTVSFADGISTVTYAGAVSSSAPETTAPPTTTPAATAPGAPSITTVTAENTALAVAFTAPGSDGGAAISDYEYALDGGAWVSAATTSSPFTISGLTNGTSYSVTLRAVNSVGAGAASAAVSGTPVLMGYQPRTINSGLWSLTNVDNFSGSAIAVMQGGSWVEVFTDSNNFCCGSFIDSDYTSLQNTTGWQISLDGGVFQDILDSQGNPSVVTWQDDRTFQFADLTWAFAAEAWAVSDHFQLRTPNGNFTNVTVTNPYSPRGVMNWILAEERWGGGGWAIGDHFVVNGSTVTFNTTSNCLSCNNGWPQQGNWSVSIDGGAPIVLSSSADTISDTKFSIYNVDASAIAAIQGATTIQLIHEFWPGAGGTEAATNAIYVG